MYDLPVIDPYEDDLVQTQEDQVQTQPLSQQTPSSQSNEDFWGFLNPCVSQRVTRFELRKENLVVTVGRNAGNIVVLSNYKISNFHAVLRWNGLENADSIVIIEDLSTNGTYINGERVGKGQQRLLKDGNEISFGVSGTSKDRNLFDFRFVFRDLVSGIVKRALYESYDMSVELGKGSFATVYKALHMASGEWVAVKVIHETKRHGNTPQPQTASEAARLGRGQTSSREINIMETLSHPNICLLREVFWNANGSVDLVLELVEGGDLLDFILTHNGLQESMAKHLTYQLCQALSYIHGKGITHRDLKPENVLLTKDNPPIVKVADFGLAKLVDSLTMLKTMCGTPSYLAPEVVSQINNSGYDSLVDSWSVGVILFSMLTNTNPFLEPSVDDVATRIRERTIDWDQLEFIKYTHPEHGPYGLSESVKDFVRQLLLDDPRQRMTQKDALQHPWLVNYRFARIDYLGIANGSGSGSSTDSSGPSEDVSMRTASLCEPDEEANEEADAVSQGFEHLKLNGNGSNDTVLPNNGDADSSGRRTPSHTPPPTRLTPSKKGGLLRRSQVLADAIDTGSKLNEPSQEMVDYVQSQEDPYTPSGSGSPSTSNASGSGRGTGNGKGLNKRVHSELTPLPEEEDEGGTAASSPLSSVSDSPPVPTRKKGRTGPAAATASATPSKKRAGRGPASARKVKAKVDEEASAGAATRRSTRTRR